MDPVETPVAAPVQPAGLTLSAEQLAAILATPDGRSVLLGAPAPAAPAEPRPVVNPIRANERPAVAFERSGPPPLTPDDDVLAELANAVFERRPARLTTVRESGETFATITTTTGGGRTKSTLGATRLSVPRIAEIVGLPTDEVGWGGSAAHPIFGAGAAGQTAEGVAKTEYSAITAGSVTPTTIAVWTDVTGQARSLPNFEAKLRNKLVRLVAVQENELLRATVAGTAGINTQAFTAGDQAIQIMRAAATIEAGVGVRPDLLLFNPADTALVFGTAVSNIMPDQLAELSLRVFGMQALPMSTQPAGFVMVGAWAAGARMPIGLAPTFLVDPYTQMKSNVVTLLLEEAVALAVEEPTAFTNVDIITP